MPIPPEPRIPTISYLPARDPFSNGFMVSPVGDEQPQPQRGRAQRGGPADQPVGASLARDAVVVAVFGRQLLVAIARRQRVEARPDREATHHGGGRGGADEGPLAL